MNYKPNESELMAYLYGELEGEAKMKVEQYLALHEDERRSLENLKSVSNLLGRVKDKEVIAPPIFIGDAKHYFWDVPYFKTIMSIAASLLLVMMVGYFMNARISMGGNEFKISFGKQQEVLPVIIPETKPTEASLTPDQVQEMINSSLANNNESFQSSFEASQQKLDASIRKTLAANSGNMDQLVRQASLASQAQISDYVSNIQAENMKMVKDYFQLTANDQKKYVEALLVDFSKYLQQQRNDDLQLVQTRLNSMEKNTNVFKQETEQILSSIITTVGNPTSTRGIKN
ncbi:MAG TPA: hypothetical protein PLJ60_10890 [Chryseolinea sp.]|nr:hypothetical protein [Chryseolinea sp.]HPH45834.1 hypothetical protein [Chryseolinea sp.]HPM30828.1 hypothetical protein [Chryseolinea sp.]